MLIPLALHTFLLQVLVWLVVKPHSGLLFKCQLFREAFLTTPTPPPPAKYSSTPSLHKVTCFAFLFLIFQHLEIHIVYFVTIEVP